MKQLIVTLGLIFLGAFIVTSLVLGNTDGTLQFAATTLMENGNSTIEKLTFLPSVNVG